MRIMLFAIGGGCHFRFVLRLSKFAVPKKHCGRPGIDRSLSMQLARFGLHPQLQEAGPKVGCVGFAQFHWVLSFRTCREPDLLLVPMG